MGNLNNWLVCIYTSVVKNICIAIPLEFELSIKAITLLMVVNGVTCHLESVKGVVMWNALIK